jgi:hypothetical protein
VPPHPRPASRGAVLLRMAAKAALCTHRSRCSSSSSPARAGNRRFGLLSAHRARRKAPYKTDLLWETRRAGGRPGRAQTAGEAGRVQEPARGREPVRATHGDLPPREASRVRRHGVAAVSFFLAPYSSIIAWNIPLGTENGCAEWHYSPSEIGGPPPEHTTGGSYRRVWAGTGGCTLWAHARGPAHLPFFGQPAATEQPRPVKRRAEI